MKITVAVIFAVFICCNAMASDEPDITGTWVRWNPRTVIRTGQTDTLLHISGDLGHYRVDYTKGGIARIKDSEGRFIFRTTTVTYSRIPITRQENLFIFTVPEQGGTLRLKLTTVDGKKALVEEGTEERPFLKKEDNKAIDSDKK